MALTNWRSLTSQGVIADTPAAGFRYRYGADFEVYLGDSPGAWAAVSWSALGAGIPTPGMHTTSFKGRWRLRVITPAEETIFQQEVELTYWFVALLTAMFGGVAFSLFTWWISAEKITTTVCGHELAEGERPATLGGMAEVGFADPASGADYTTDTAYFMTEWTSPIYLFNIPAGSRIKIDFHNIGYSKLASSLAAIQTQVIAATGAFCRLPGYGMLVGARAGDTAGMEAYAWHAPWGDPPDLEWGDALWSSGVGSSGGRAVWVPYVGGGRVALLWEGLGALLYAESNNLADAEGWEGPTTVLPGHTLLGADRDTDGTLWILARNADGQVVGYRAARSLNRDLLLRVGPPTVCRMADGSPLNLTSADYFEVDHGVAHVVVDRGNRLDYYQGMNGMATWHRHQDEEGG